MVDQNQSIAESPMGTAMVRGFNTYLGIVAAMMVIDAVRYVGGQVYDHFTEEGEGDSSIKTLKADSPVAVRIRCFLEEVRKNRSDVVAKYSNNPEALAADLQSIGMLGPVDHSKWASEIEFLRGLGGKDQVDPETVTPVTTDGFDATTRNDEIAELRKLVEGLQNQVSDQNEQILSLKSA